MTTPIGRRFAAGLATVVVAVTFFAVYYAQRPGYNWDMIAYMAVALVDSGVPKSAVHQKTYDALSVVPESARKPLLESGEYRINVAKDPDKFLAQLPFYTVKPLYPALMSLLYRAGIGLVNASVIVSAAAYAGICVLLFIWFSKWAPISVIVPLVIFLALTPFLTRFARVSTPDTLSTLLVLLGLYVVFEKDRAGLGAGILILAITARPDNAIYAWWLSCYLLLVQRISLAKFIVICAVAALVYFCLTWISGNYGWKVLMYYTFVDFNMDFQNFPPLGLKDYLWIYVRGLDRLVFLDSEYFGIFAALGWGAVCLKLRGPARHDKYLHLVGIAAICAATRALVLPYDFARAFLPSYLMLLVAFVQVCCAMSQEKASGVAPDGP